MENTYIDRTTVDNLVADHESRLRILEKNMTETKVYMQQMVSYTGWLVKIVAAGFAGAIISFIVQGGLV